MSDHLDELIELLKSVGATMTLYGKPVTADEVRAHATANVIERLVDRACTKCGFDPKATVAKTWTFFVARKTPSMNDHLVNVGPKAFLYRKERDAWCWLFRAARLEQRIPVARRRRRATLTRLFAGRERERDRDNLIGGMKPILDAMVSEGLLLNDTEGAAELYYEQQQSDRSGLQIELGEFV